MEKKTKVLFLSVHNSVRGQMAEGFLRSMAGDRFIATSSGIESGDSVDPVATEVMAEVGIDISKQHPKNISEWFKEHFGYVITLADAARERSPVFPFTPHLLHWSLRDPTVANGTAEERKQAFREVRDEIGLKINEFLEEVRRQEVNGRMAAAF